ncbi:MAG: transcriptional coactivator p15/PC4 family protein [Leptospiraceae bacterium]|nr:transcriptional coactivator p15/PC4 family protein [Leptospiraceae bacterium]MCP5499054.1 transcriptional coactivator p15/PC4 family protein [Leptospiraceae bacterium]
MSLGVVRDIDKGKGEVIRVEVSEYRGKKLLNLRIWYYDENQELKPTKKGIAISPDLFEAVKEAFLEGGEKLLSDV